MADKSPDEITSQAPTLPNLAQQMVKLTASVQRLIGRNRLLREALAEAIEAFEGMNDDKINRDLLPRLRHTLTQSLE
jgi:hypothetical protein